MRRVSIFGFIFFFLLTGCGKKEPPNPSPPQQLSAFDDVWFSDRNGKKPGKDLYFIAEGGGIRSWLIISSIEGEGPIFKAKELDSTFGDDPEQLKKWNDIGSVIRSEEYDCKNNRVRTLFSEAYRDKMALTPAFHQERDLQEWRFLESDTQGGRLLEFVCSHKTIEVSNSPANSIDVAPSNSSAMAHTPVLAPASAVPAPDVVDNTPFSPSFDCAKASNGQEKMVCGDSELAKLDVELSQAYSRARENATDKDSLRKTQTEWIKQGFRACSDKPCLVAAYKSRITELQR